MMFEPSERHQPAELPATEVAVLLIEGTEVVLERVARFKDAIERLVVTSDGPRHAIKHLQRQLRDLVQDLQAAAAELAAVEPASRSIP